MPMVDSAHGGFGKAFRFPPPDKFDDFGNRIPREKPVVRNTPLPVTGDYEHVVRQAPEVAW